MDNVGMAVMHGLCYQEAGKMRLIDADKLENDIVENITVKAVSRMLAITQGQPTVKSIPVEWIKAYTRKSISVADYWAIVRMVLTWEKSEGRKYD